MENPQRISPPPGRLTRLSTLLAGSLVFFALPAGWALSPMTQYQDLVAGEGEPGFEDGPFYSAQFNRPLGLALNDDGSVLYVADQQNNRVRAVLLDQQNTVETAAGTQTAGSKDGPLSIGTLNRPTDLAALPDGTVAVADQDGALIRLIDPKAKTLSTLCEGEGFTASDGKSPVKLAPVWNMAYLPGRDCLCFSQPQEGTLRYYDFKTRKVETCLKDDPRIPHPQALCVEGGRLVVADRDLPQVYALQPQDLKPLRIPVALPSLPPTPQGPPSASVPLQTVGQAHQALALASSNGFLYALQADEQAPVFRILPDAKPVTFESVSGSRLLRPSPGHILPVFQEMKPQDPVGFVADPRSRRRFYVSGTARCLVGSVRDLYEGDFDPLHGEDYKSSGGLHDYEYADSKPPKTFRILLVGRCFLYWESNSLVFEKEGFDFGRQDYMLNVSKRTELLLNTEAALGDYPCRFEVFNGGMHHGGNCMDIWADYVVPPLVRKYGIDLVLMLHDDGFNYFDPYYISPLTAEGIPSDQFDPEFRLEPNEEKFNTPQLRDFVKLCRADKALHEDRKDVWGFDLDTILADPPARKSLLEIMRPAYSLLKSKVEGIQVGEGKKARVETWFYPAGNFSSKGTRKFYSDLCGAAGIPFVDLSDDFTAVNLTYWPYKYDPVTGGHFTAEGMDLFSRIIVHELTARHEIPLKEDRH